VGSKPPPRRGTRSGGAQSSSPRLLSSRRPFWLLAGLGFRTSETSPNSSMPRKNHQQLTFSLEGRPARHSRSRVSEEDWLMRVATWRSSFVALSTEHGPAGWSGRTSPVSCRRTKDGILEPSWGRWKSSGMGGPIERWTLSTSSWPSDGSASSLLDILEAGLLPARYFLSAQACRGILRRAEKRGRKLPDLLGRALQEAAGETT